MLRKKIGIDLGTANTVVYVEGTGIIAEEPTVIAFSHEERKVVAIGNEAKLMLGKVPKDIIAKRPLKNGVIASFRLTEALLNYFIKKASGGLRIFKPDVMISVPAGVTSVEERAVIEAAINAGANNVNLIPEPIAAALGANMPISTSTGNMIVNIGGGTSEIAVMSLNGIVAFKSEKVAGDELNEKIALYIKKKYSVYIGEQMAERIKKSIVSAIPLKNPPEIEIRGRDANHGNPNTIKLNSNDLLAAISPSLEVIANSIREVLENTPPELASDIIDRGIVLSGGSAELLNLDEYFTQNLNIPFHVVDDPIHSVIRGIAIAMKNIELIKKSLLGE
ncbi:MAG: rod shape-determining protein [bacterium]